MQQGAYQKLFARAGFPVVGIREDGTVHFKNPAAKKYLPMLRRGADAIRRLRGRVPLSPGTLAEIAGDSPYRRAVVLADENQFVLLFLARLQYPDGEAMAKRIVDARGTELSSFFPAEEEDAAASEALPFGRERIYTDLVGIAAQSSPTDTCVYDVQEIINRLSAHLKGAFRSLGYRISLCNPIPEWEKKYVKLDLYDFVFSFSRLLYLQMRCSENGTVGIECGYDEDSGCCLFRFTARTSLSAASIRKSKNIVSLLSRLAPECAPELSFLPNREELSRGTQFSIDKYGKLILEYRVKYLEQPVLHIRSVDFENLELDAAIAGFLREIRAAVGKRQ